jgi:hypothetical protein
VGCLAWDDKLVGIEQTGQYITVWFLEPNTPLLSMILSCWCVKHQKFEQFGAMHDLTSLYPYLWSCPNGRTKVREFSRQHQMLAHMHVDMSAVLAKYVLRSPPFFKECVFLCAKRIQIYLKWTNKAPPVLRLKDTILFMCMECDTCHAYITLRTTCETKLDLARSKRELYHLTLASYN